MQRCTCQSACERRCSNVQHIIIICHIFINYIIIVCFFIKYECKVGDKIKTGL